MKKKPIMAACSYCKGCGSVEITGIYAETFRLLNAQQHECSGADLAAKAGCKPTAMNNRLAALEEHGLVVSRRYGRQRLFSARPQ